MTPINPFLKRRYATVQLHSGNTIEDFEDVVVRDDESNEDIKNRLVKMFNLSPNTQFIHIKRHD